MIRTITVYTGHNEYAIAAHAHAIEMAKQFGARLKVVNVWEAEKGGMLEASNESASDVMHGNLEDIMAAAARSGVRVDEGVRGNGMVRGLPEEARETDLLVLGLPTDEDRNRTDEGDHLVRKERSVLRKVDCALLLVNRPPAPIRKILALYEDSSSGKSMLRMVAAIAERYGAKLGLLTIENDLARAMALSASAAEYVKGFDIPAVEQLAQDGPTGSKVGILEEADAFDADLIAMGEEGHNWLERFFGENLAERTALSTSIPLLLVR